MVRKIDHFFGISKAGSTFRKEAIGGIVTFLTVSYIVVVNPSVLINVIPGASENPELFSQFFGAFMVATILSSVVGTILMAFWAKYPFALAPGMGLNAFFAYTVCIGMGIDWRIALTAIFFEGIIFIVITLGGLRTLITRGIPKSLKMGIGVGIGLFIALIGLENGGMIVQNPSTLVELGSVYSLDVLITAFGILLISILYVLKVPGSVLFGILGSAGLSWLTGHAPFQGLVGRVPSIEPIFAKMVFEPDVIFTFGFITVMLTFFFLDLFDTAGTLIGLSNTSGFANSDGNLDRDKEAFMCDAIATTAGAVLGTSTTTAYIESAAGIAEGARTGFASVVTSIAMLAMLFFSPLAASIPGAATAPALIFVGFLMTRSATKIDWQDATESIPAFLTLLMIPLTYSISHGIAVGFIAYPIIKLFTGRFRDTNILTWILAGMFVFYLAIG